MQTLKDKNVLLIGATGGIGSRTAKLLAGSGANLFLAGRNADKLQQVATECNVPADRTFALDISKPTEVTALKEKYFQQISSIDILVNAAGIGIIKSMDTLDESEFLSDYGIRSLSKYHLNNPYKVSVNGIEFGISYTPAESDSGLFGGNSNWRGPIWMPVNYMIIDSLHKFHQYYGDDFKVECPTGSGIFMNLFEVANELYKRVSAIFLKDANGNRALFGTDHKMQTDPDFNDYILFHEYFDGDNGRGVGASHQTGWTGLIANCLQKI